MLYFRVKYLSFFLILISIFSFLNIIYSYYFNLYLNLNTYYFSLIISGGIGLFFYKLRPKLVIIGENDIWLFFYLYCKIFRIPIILVNYNYNKYGKTYNKIRNFYYQNKVIYLV